MAILPESKAGFNLEQMVKKFKVFTLFSLRDELPLTGSWDRIAQIYMFSLK
jgi:hypothetical protein